MHAGVANGSGVTKPKSKPAAAPKKVKYAVVKGPTIAGSHMAVDLLCIGCNAVSNVKMTELAGEKKWLAPSVNSSGFVIWKSESTYMLPSAPTCAKCSLKFF